MIDLHPEHDKQYMIFASDLPAEDTINLLNKHLVPFLSVNGRYKGMNEQSYIVPAGYKVRSLGILDKQESVLLLGALQGNARPARLQYSDGRVQELGAFMEVTKEEAIAQDAYTEKNGAYFIVKERN
jgi:hypothetical protein